jgi:glycosyltransferase involved in cell wall biosynthesis
MFDICSRRELMIKQKVLMVAYAQYYNDARIKAYVNALIRAGTSVDVVCLYDSYSKSYDYGKATVNITFVNNKYQGKSAIRYLIGYFSFFMRSLFIVTAKYFRARYPVIHVHNQPDILVFCALIPKLFGARIILDMHDIMIAAVLSKFRGIKQWILYYAVKIQTKISVSFCDMLICADHSQKDFLNEKGIAHSSTYVMMNVPDETLFQRRTNIPNNKELRVIYHGTISHRLGIDLAIQAVERVAEKIPIKFKIIGNGEQKEELVAYCKKKGILDSLIFFYDFIPVERLQNEIEKYDVGIVANRRTLTGERCMLPVKMMECLAIGLPVIVPRLPVIQYYFSEKMVSFFEPENIDDMAQRIIELSMEPSLGEQQVLNAREFFRKYNYKDQQREYLRIIQES